MSIHSPIACFEEPPEASAWPGPRAVDAVLREGARLLFEQCRQDLHAWLSEVDLQCMFYAILRREFPAHGMPSRAIHAGYSLKLPQQHLWQLKKRSRALPVDILIVAPHTIRAARGRRWEAQYVAAVEVKRGFERYREIREDLDKLAAIHSAWPEMLCYMLIMGYRNRQESVAAVERAAQEAGVTLLAENYWRLERPVEQQVLV